MVCERLQHDDVPLLTLAGPGGVGKTRLAIEAANALAPRFADGVIFVALDSLRDPALVLPAIASALVLGDRDNRPLLDHLIEHLRHRQLLLVLDNFEPVIEAGPVISRLLSACAGLKVLVTSRSVLHVSLEETLMVPTLAISAAVDLFMARSRAAGARFELTAANVTAVAKICARLDGLPLAVELAAARTPSLTPVELIARLDRALPILNRGARDQPDRLQTMERAIAWSYDLLTADEQHIFQILSVFTGSFDIAVAEGLVDEIGSCDAPLDGIFALVGKSLLQRDADAGGDGSRLRMLQTVREFGLGQLRASGEEPVVRAAHARRMADPARLDADHDNIRAGLAWADATDNDGALAPTSAEDGSVPVGTITHESPLAIVLTAREREVLRLLADGCTDREIARALSISPRTVGGHVTNLLTKLDVSSRTAAVSLAMRRGLV
jgi:predicted ATPase